MWSPSVHLLVDTWAVLWILAMVSETWDVHVRVLVVDVQYLHTEWKFTQAPTLC